jgi:hypothetical protein
MIRELHSFLGFGPDGGPACWTEGVDDFLGVEFLGVLELLDNGSGWSAVMGRSVKDEGRRGVGWGRGESALCIRERETGIVPRM